MAPARRYLPRIMTMARILAGVISVALVLLALASCSNDIAETGTPSKATFGDSDCASCLASSCGSERATCDADPDCSSHLACVYSCPVGADGDVDTACAAGCPAPTSSAGEQARVALDACQTTGAGASCEACGTSNECGSHPVLDQCCDMAHEDDDICEVCKAERCCDTRAAADNPSTNAYYDCVIACIDAGTLLDTCFLECATTHPDGVADFAPQFACIVGPCLTDCSDAAPNACATCISIDQCAVPTANLYADPAGFLLMACIGECGLPLTTECVDACKTQYPSGAALWDAFSTCTSLSCVDVC